MDQCSISVPSALAPIRAAVTEAELSYPILCYPDDPTTRKTQTDHIRRTANKELQLHKGKKKVKEATTEQMGINTEAYILTWLEAVQPLHEHTTSTDWAFHFLLHVPLIREAVFYFLQCDFDLILVPKWLKRDLKKRKKLDILAFCASTFEKHRNQS